MTDTERKQRWRKRITERGYKRVEVRLKPELVETIQRDGEYQGRGIAGCCAKAIEAYYRRRK